MDNHSYRPIDANMSTCYCNMRSWGQQAYNRIVFLLYQFVNTEVLTGQINFILLNDICRLRQIDALVYENVYLYSVCVDKNFLCHFIESINSPYDKEASKCKMSDFILTQLKFSWYFTCISLSFCFIGEWHLIYHAIFSYVSLMDCVSNFDI